jgi:hypothetical protein
VPFRVRKLPKATLCQHFKILREVPLKQFTKLKIELSGGFTRRGRGRSLNFVNRDIVPVEATLTMVLPLLRPPSRQVEAGNRSLAASEISWKFDHAADCR